MSDRERAKVECLERLNRVLSALAEDLRLKMGSQAREAIERGILDAIAEAAKRLSAQELLELAAAKEAGKKPPVKA